MSDTHGGTDMTETMTTEQRIERIIERQTDLRGGVLQVTVNPPWPGVTRWQVYWQHKRRAPGITGQGDTLDQALDDLHDAIVEKWA